MNVAMIGAGYVGLVSGACFADFGHHVVCIDNDVQRVESLRAGLIPIFEPGLDDLVGTNMRSNRLSFSGQLPDAVADADLVFIAVGTPSRRGDGHADLSFVYQAAEAIAAALRGFTVIVTKSTVPVGTGDEIENIIRKVRPDADFAVVSNPEFLREGAAIGDFKRPDRIIVGSEDERAKAVMVDLYRPLSLNEPPLVFMSRRAAELTKYAANAFLATKITFINEIADLCEKVGANVQDVARGIGMDNRIGSKFLHAGPGYGGSCFPKDTLALIRTAQEAGAPLRIVETVADTNTRRKKSMAGRVVQACGGSVEGKTIAILGLAFKPNTDDMRDAPSLDLVPGLMAKGAHIRAHDPESMEAARLLLPGIEYCSDPYACARGAQALVIVTEWDAFRALDLDRLKGQLAEPVIVDLRNIYRPSDMKQRGFHYISVGRP
ncbi:MAG: UDP-glucose/GDP-mannose dehydrogenase family protein [Beijerinckiaceae bacterium]|nr:UDP-glucose/GDP-mannose dehydrogenase family protein [Beijerinckiaceae bacterium]